MPEDVNPIDEAIDRAERWLQRLDAERDEVARLIVDLHALKYQPPMLFAERPRRNVKAVLPAVKRAIRAKVG